MKNLWKIVMAAGAVLSIGASAHALEYTDTDYADEFLSEGESYTGKWSYGPIAAGHSITSVKTWFYFSDSDYDDDEYKIMIGTGEAPTDYTSSVTKVDKKGDWEVYLPFLSNVAMLFEDAANGYLSFTVLATDNSTSWDNDLKLKKAKVKITTERTTTRVPDGASTVALLGLGLLGLLGAKRTLNRR